MMEIINLSRRNFIKSSALMGGGLVLGVCLFETAFSQRAGRIGGYAVEVLRGTAASDNLLGGFRNAYLLGAVLCVAGLCIFCLSLLKKRTRPAQSSIKK